MSPDRNRERMVQVYRGSGSLEVEAIAEELRAAGITCNIEGGEIASAFAGLTALDGVTLMSVVVLESDAARAHDIASRWLHERSLHQESDDA